MRLSPETCRVKAIAKNKNAPEDVRNHRPKHVELIGIINKPLLLHLVGVYIIVSDAQSNKHQSVFCEVGSWLFYAVRRTGRQHRGCIIPQPVTHSLLLLKMGKIIARNMLS